MPLAFRRIILPQLSLNQKRLSSSGLSVKQQKKGTKTLFAAHIALFVFIKSNYLIKSIQESANIKKTNQDLKKYLLKHSIYLLTNLLDQKNVNFTESLQNFIIKVSAESLGFFLQNLCFFTTSFVPYSDRFANPFPCEPKHSLTVFSIVVQLLKNERKKGLETSFCERKLLRRVCCVEKSYYFQSNYLANFLIIVYLSHATNHFRQSYTSKQQSLYWQTHSSSPYNILSLSSSKSLQLNSNNIIIISMKASSLMQRRKMNLGQLKSTIQQLSILPKDKQPLGNPFFPNNSAKSQNFVKNEQETTLTEDKAFDFVPRIISEIALKKKFSEWPEQTLKNFDQMFQTHEILGEGAHGVVKRCTHKSSGHAYAVKILKMQDEHFHFLKTNFINIKQLKHQSVISYKALFLNSKLKKCHLVMQYLPYTHLKRPLKEDTLKSVFYKLLDTLEFIHKNGICHRDIKPENVLYDREKQVFKIIDFGVSKNMKLRGRYEEMLTKTGTLYYKAPEMFYGGGYTEKVDSWAVGVTLYQMVVGSTPFASEYLAETIENILHKEPDLQREEFKTLEPVLKDLLARLLKRNPKERLSCEQAKKHLWFNPNLSEIDTLRSANFQLLNMRQSQKENFHLNSLTRNTSLTGPTKEEMNQVSKTDKKVMKKYLEIMSKHPSTIEQELSIDFVESEDEENADTLAKESEKDVEKTPKTSVTMSKGCSEIVKGSVEG